MKTEEERLLELHCTPDGYRDMDSQALAQRQAIATASTMEHREDAGKAARKAPADGAARVVQNGRLGTEIMLIYSDFQPLWNSLIEDEGRREQAHAEA